MKKILLSMIMLCTMVSAWSYETESVTLLFSDCDKTTWKTTDSETGIYVQANPYTTNKEEGNNWWKVDERYKLGLFAPKGYVITGVMFTFIPSNLATNSCCIDQCDRLVYNETSKRWVQNDGGLDYYSTIYFTATEMAYVKSVVVTYHKHAFTHTGAVAASCTATGTKEYWTCSECEHMYSDDAGVNKVTDLSSLVVAATNHNGTMREIAEVPATCDEKGKLHHWHCDACGGDFKDEDGTTALGNEEMEIDINPANHPDALVEHARVEATCTTAGNVQYWHCDHCNKNFGDKDGTGKAIADVTIPATNHANKTFTDYVAPTANKEGNVAYWYCPDCEKHFGNAACTNELTEWTLEKLMNKIHFNFTGSAVPVETEHYMNATKFNFTDDGDVILTVNGESVTYDKDMIDKVKFSNGTPTAQIKANEDPGKGTYYSTFYSSLESYAVPEGFTAYRGEISDDGTMLNLTSVDVMSRGKGYILKGTTNSGSLEVTENDDSGSSDNILLGTDEATALGANQYALSLGQNGVGFYLWEGKAIGANKAYLTLESPTMAKAFTFQFEDEITGINDPQLPTLDSQPTYNLNGVRVNDNYKGIVIKNGKKIYQK